MFILNEVMSDVQFELWYECSIIELARQTPLLSIYVQFELWVFDCKTGMSIAQLML